MKRYSLWFLVALFIFSLRPWFCTAQVQQAPDWEWAKAIPTLAFEDGVLPGPILVSAQENIWIGGSFSNGVVLGPETFLVNQPPLPYNLFDGFLAQYTSQGALQASVHAPKTQFLALAQDSYGASFSLSYVQDSTGAGFLQMSKFNENGLFGSQEIPYTSPTLDGVALAVTPEGEVYVTASFLDTLTLGNTTLISAGYQDVFLAKYSAQLQLEWVKSAGGSGTDVGMALGITHTGGCYLSGTFQDTAQFMGWQLTSQGNQDMFLASFSPVGALTWIGTAGGAGLDRPLSLAVTPYSQVLVTGIFPGTAVFGNDTLTSLGNDDIFVSAWSVAGQPLWAKSGGTPSFDYPSRIATDSTGHRYLLLGAAANGFVYNGAPLAGAQTEANYLLKLNTAGEQVWVKRLGDAAGTGQVWGSGLEVTPGGKSYLTGAYKGAPVFSTTALPQAPNLAFNGFVAVLSATVVGLEEELGSGLTGVQAYPNPFQGGFSVAFTAVNPLKMVFSLTDLLGRELYRKAAEASPGKNVLQLLPEKELAPGVYFLRVASGNQTQVIRMVGQ